MFGTYLIEVSKKALTPAVRVTDGLQILTASAAPIALPLLGVDMTEDLTTNILSYVGLVAIGFIAIRFFWAPYAIWKEQSLDNAGLRLELSKPERLVMENVARHRAKALTKIPRQLHELDKYAYYNDVAARTQATANTFIKIQSLAAQAGLKGDFHKALVKLLGYCRQPSAVDLETARIRSDLRDHMISFVHGQITGEFLLSQLPPNIEEETQP